MSLVNEGTLVRIRPVGEADLEAMLQWRLESASLGGFNPPSIRSLEAERKRWAETHWISREVTILAIEALPDERLVGRVGFASDSPGYETMVRTFSHIGDPKDRGLGYATEARLLLINYLFLTTSLERIYSETEEANLPARRSLEKCGMHFEGVLRHLFFDMGRWVDMAVYSILRPEWETSPLYEECRLAFQRPWYAQGNYGKPAVTEGEA